jgi:predicted phosphoadenosine phosphosulfate sulfurtransferase
VTRQRMFLDINCVEAARQRIRHVYDTFDTVCVQFSGGKDSTAALYLAKEVHEERGLGPVKVIFRDEEMVSPLVIDFIQKVRDFDWVDMEWYCFDGDTEVITRHGVERIADLAGSDHELMTDRGVWVKAPIWHFGTQPVQAITIERAGQQKVIRATPEHRWFLNKRWTDSGKQYEERAETTTKDLKPGDVLSGTWKFRHVKNPSSFGIAHGFTFGDGNIASNGCQVTFNGEKDTALKAHFDGHITSTSKGARKDGISQPRAIGLPFFFKQKPSLDESPQYLYGWLAGYFAADGCVTETGKCVMSSSSKENLEFVRTLCTNLGIFTYGVRKCQPGTFNPDGEMWEITLAKEDLNEEFFLIWHHRERWLASKKTASRRRRLWKVVSVSEIQEETDVYCAVVPSTHSFALADHILTGNCLPMSQEVWVLGRREFCLLWSPKRAAQGRLVREMPPWAIRAEHFGLDPSQVIPESVDYYTMQGKKGKTAFITGVRANESMIRYRSCVQKLHENYIVHPYKLAKSVPLKFAKVIYDWTTDDVLKFITEEHGAEYCEYYDLASITGSNTRIGIPLHAVAIRRIGDVVRTEPEFYDDLVRCFPHIDAQRRWWPEFDIEKLIKRYADGGWDGVRRCIDDNFITPGKRTRAKAFSAEFRKKHAKDPNSYPIHWLIRNLLLNEITPTTSVSPIGPGTKAYSLQLKEAQQQAELDSLDIQDDDL